MTWCIRPKASPSRTRQHVLADNAALSTSGYRDVAFPNRQQAQEWLRDQPSSVSTLLEAYELPPGVSHWTEDTLYGGGGNDTLP